MHRFRIKKLNQDLERVRELQQQLAVLRGIQASRLSAKKAVIKTTNDEAFIATEPALTDEGGERSRKGTYMGIESYFVEAFQTYDHLTFSLFRLYVSCYD